MNVRNKKKFINFLIIIMALFPCATTNGMQSANYIIDKDSINFGGMEDSESASYRISDTMGETGTGESSSSNYDLNAGYRESASAVATYISISNPADVAMSPDIGGISGGTGDGSAVWNVKTNSPSGYQVSIKSSTSPAMQSGSYSFADYTPVSAGVPDYAWGISSSDSEFGYTVEGTNTVAKFLDDGNTCNTGSGNIVDKCWLNLSTSDQSIVSTSSSNEPSGTDTTVKFRAESGASRLQPEGSYSSTVVVTAVAL